MVSKDNSKNVPLRVHSNTEYEAQNSGVEYNFPKFSFETTIKLKIGSRYSPSDADNEAKLGKGITLFIETNNIRKDYDKYSLNPTLELITDEKKNFQINLDDLISNEVSIC